VQRTDSLDGTVGPSIVVAVVAAVEVGCIVVETGYIVVDSSKEIGTEKKRKEIRKRIVEQRRMGTDERQKRKKGTLEMQKRRTLEKHMRMI